MPGTVKRDCNKNFCNDVIFNFGSDQCREEGDFLAVVGNTHCKLGYANPKAVKIHSVGLTWCGAPKCGVEEFVLIINGQEYHIDGLLVSDGDEKCGHLCVKDLSIWVPECSTIAVKGVAFEREPYDATCSVELSVWAEAMCEIGQDNDSGVFEVYTPLQVIPGDLPQLFTPINFQTLRLNTIPTYVSWNGSDTFTLESGVYRLEGHQFINWNYSVNIRIDQLIAVDDTTGYLAIPGSEDTNSVLNGNVGSTTVRNAVFYEVPFGQTWTFQLWARATTDTATYADYGANFLIERFDDVCLPQ